jgi:hypothetical protein
MPANLTHMVVDALKPGVVERLAASLGEPPAATRKALTTALPVALLGLINKSASARGADDIRDAIHQNRLVGGSLDDLATRPQLTAPAGGFLAGGQTGAERLLDGPTAQSAERLALYADVRRSSAHSLMGLSVPLLLSALVRAYPSPLDTASVQRALAEQAPLAHRAVPPGFGPAPAASVAKPAAARPPAESDDKPGGWWTWAVALGRAGAGGVRLRLLGRGAGPSGRSGRRAGRSRDSWRRRRSCRAAPPTRSRRR